jgi:hypothetical protein
VPESVARGYVMRRSSFTAVASARLNPILAPRGFPYAAHHNGVAAPGEPAIHNPDSVLFHCDGVDSVADLLVRYPSWPTRLRASYGPQEILCLDLWVKQERGERSWDFEIFEDDVVSVAGSDAEQRLARADAGPLDQWVDGLALMLDTYFRALETTAPDVER